MSFLSLLHYFSAVFSAELMSDLLDHFDLPDQTHQCYFFGYQVGGCSLIWHVKSIGLYKLQAASVLDLSLCVVRMLKLSMSTGLLDLVKFS